MTKKINDYLRMGLNVTDTVSYGGWHLVKILLEPYQKFLSVASLATVKLPIMPLLVYTDWNKDVEESVDKFVTKHRLNRVQVRSQSAGLPVGGKAFYHLPIGRISEASLELFKQGATIVGIQLPGNIYRNDYSVHIDFDWPGLDVYLEIVGPGFTATHLSKGGLMHERIQLNILSGRYDRIYTVSDKDYRENVTFLDTFKL